MPAREARNNLLNVGERLLNMDIFKRHINRAILALH